MLIVIININTFSQSKNQNCSEALGLCNRNPVSIQNIDNNISNQKLITNCYNKNFPTDHMKWFKWKIKNSGNLSFTILPLDGNDDIDFILYEANDINNCNNLKEIRCVASGRNLGENNENDCTGATGLNDKISESSIRNGCQGNNKFAKSIAAEIGVTYFLAVNNFKSEKGFILTFTGNAEFDNSISECIDINTNNDIADLKNGYSVSNPYPNPTSNDVFIDINSPSASNCNVYLINAFGEIIDNQFVNLSSGSNQVKFNMNRYTSGVYFIKTRFSDGSLHLSKIIK